MIRVGCVCSLFFGVFVFNISLVSALNPVKVVEQIENHYRKNCPFEARFMQEVYSPGSTLPSIKAEGRIVYAGRYKMKWEYNFPDKQTFVILPNISWMYVPEDKQIQVFDTQSLEKTAIAAAFSQGILKYFSVRSITRFLSDKNDNKDNNLVIITFEPREKNYDIKNLSVVVNVVTNKIIRLETLDIVGRKNILMFKNENHLKGVKPEEFGPPDLKEVVIIDSEGNIMDKKKFISVVKSLDLKGACKDDQK